MFRRQKKIKGMLIERGKRNKDIVVGLDVGTTKICAVIGQMTMHRLDILAVSSHSSNGLRKGVVIDIEAATESIKKAISEANHQTGLDIRKVIVGISGSHIKSFKGCGAVSIRGKRVTHEDVNMAIDSAGVACVPLDREILYVIPFDFILDGRTGIKEPVGMAGSRLEVNVHIITGAVEFVQNLLMCCEKAGLDVLDIVLGPLASSESILSVHEKDVGVAIIDIGGGTTDIAVYKDGQLRLASILGIGGNHFTNDISLVLGIPFEQAEEIKKRISVLSNIEDDFGIDYNFQDSNIAAVPKRQIAEIIYLRAEELFELVRKEIQVAYNNEIAGFGAVLTGGASLIKGIDKLAEGILSMPVRIGYPQIRDQGRAFQINGLRNEFNSPIYAAGIGLVLCGAEQVMYEKEFVFTPNVFNRVIDKMTVWFKGRGNV